MNHTIISEAISHASSKMAPLEGNFYDWRHTETIYQESQQLARAAGLDESQTLVLSLAAIFHDTGLAFSKENHEDQSKIIATEFLKSQAIAQDIIDQVCHAIEATKMPFMPADKIGALLQDASQYFLSKDNWKEQNKLLRREKLALGVSFMDDEWDKYNLDLLKNTVYQSREGKQRYDSGKDKNRDQLKDAVKKDKKKTDSLINSNRTAEMLFKTALRNHINLTQIADNKANIMLSINALILTFALPTLLRKDLDKDILFIIPYGMIGVTCVISIVYAALSTQPGKFKGKFNLQDIQSGKGSLFFFGNFYDSSLQEYTDAMKMSLQQEQNLDEAAILDLYFMGKSLGRKFNLLRKCYSFFLVGITVSSLLFIVGFLINK